MSNKEDDISTKVVDIIAGKLQTDREKITSNSSFVDDLNADSLDLVEIIMAIEEELECTIPDEDAGKMQTVQDVINYIKAKKMNR